MADVIRWQATIAEECQTTLSPHKNTQVKDNLKGEPEIYGRPGKDPTWKYSIWPHVSQLALQCY